MNGIDKTVWERIEALEAQVKKLEIIVDGNYNWKVEHIQNHIKSEERIKKLEDTPRIIYKTYQIGDGPGL